MEPKQSVEVPVSCLDERMRRRVKGERLTGKGIDFFDNLVRYVEMWQMGVHIERCYAFKQLVDIPLTRYRQGSRRLIAQSTGVEPELILDRVTKAGKYR